MPEAVKLTDKDRLDAALKLIHGVHLDEAMIRAHVMRPENVLGVSSDRGRDDERVPAAIGGPPVVHPGYALDVPGFPRGDRGSAQRLRRRLRDALERERGADRHARVGLG
jgi:hypothetical protein